MSEIETGPLFSLWQHNNQTHTHDSNLGKRLRNLKCKLWKKGCPGGFSSSIKTFFSETVATAICSVAWSCIILYSHTHLKEKDIEAETAKLRLQ